MKKPRVKGEYCQSTEECAWVKGHKGGSCDYQCVFFEDLYEGDGECHKVDEACEDGNSEDDGEGEEEEDEEEEEEEDDDDDEVLVLVLGLFEFLFCFVFEFFDLITLRLTQSGG